MPPGPMRPHSGTVVIDGYVSLYSFINMVAVASLSPSLPRRNTTCPLLVDTSFHAISEPMKIYMRRYRAPSGPRPTPILDHYSHSRFPPGLGRLNIKLQFSPLEAVLSITGVLLSSLCHALRATTSCLLLPDEPVGTRNQT